MSRIRRPLPTCMLALLYAAFLVVGCAQHDTPYEEQAVIPFVEGIEKDMVGEPQLNLNELLGRERSAAVGEMAAHVRKALPEFGTVRKGGFPEDYEETLMANALDYADVDNDATLELLSKMAVVHAQADP